MLLRTSSLLAALLVSSAAAENPAPAPAVNGLRWRIPYPAQFTTFDALPFQATLANAGAKPLQFTDLGSRKAVELILTAAGQAPVRKPLPENADLQAARGGTLNAGAYAFFVRCDLRRAFGPLAPGKYKVEIALAAGGYRTDSPGFQPRPVRSAPFRFAVVKTTLQEAQQKNERAEGLTLEVKGPKDRRVAVLTNRRGKAVTFLAYGPDRKDAPASSLLTVPRWNGTKWQAGIGGGFCGTGLERFTVNPGESRELQLPPYPEGIARLQLDCVEGEGKGAKQLVAASDAFVARPN